MRRELLLLLFTAAALAQIAPGTFDAAVQSYWQAHSSGRFDEAAANREAARHLLEQTPVEAPAFAARAWTAAHLYEQAGRNAEARAVASEALSRVGSLGASHPARLVLLNFLAASWEQDGSLLKAAGYREQEVVALQSAPGAVVPVEGVLPPDFNSAYQDLAYLYRRLGRSVDADEMEAKIEARAKTNDNDLANFYEQHGQPGKAAEIYRKLADQAANPDQAADALSPLFYRLLQDGQYREAAAAAKQAIGAMKAAGREDASEQTAVMLRNLAGAMEVAELRTEADEVYRQLLNESQAAGPASYLQALMSYGDHLASTNRAEEGYRLLRDYRTHQPISDPADDAGYLLVLAHVAEEAGHAEQAKQFEQAANARVEPVAFEQSPIGKAEDAAAGGKPDDAFTFALQAIDAAAPSPEGWRTLSPICKIAAALAALGQPALAEKLYQRLFLLADASSSDDIRPLVYTVGLYPEFLATQPDRLPEVPAAIARYRDLVIASDGPASGNLVEVMEMAIEFERAHGSKDRARFAAQELLAFVESLSGRTSEAYLETVKKLGSNLSPNE